MTTMMCDKICATLDARIGQTNSPVGDIMSLSVGSIIEFREIAGEPVKLYANNTHIGYGDVVVIDGHFGLRITKMLQG